MFSAFLTKIERWPLINLFVLAGLLVALCQLVAMALVVDLQPSTTDVRDQGFQDYREQVALMADCPDPMQLDVRPLRHGCIQHAETPHNRAGCPNAAALQQSGWASSAQQDPGIEEPTSSASMCPNLREL